MCVCVAIDISMENESERVNNWKYVYTQKYQRKFTATTITIKYLLAMRLQ